jgi:TRAP-type mannitol/chloroaromatic compound transport system permease large subunit
MTDIMLGAAPFVGIMLIGLLTIILFPSIATFLPSLMTK